MKRNLPMNKLFFYLTLPKLNTSAIVMSRILILVRHAQAESPYTENDVNRKLTAMGERDARHIGRWLAQRVKEIDKVISSSADRAKQTAEIIVEEFKQNHVIQLSEEMYEASPRTMLAALNDCDENWQKVLFVAHNPTISYFADLLTSSSVESMNPGSAVLIEFEDLSWSEVSQGTGNLVQIQNPQDI